MHENQRRQHVAPLISCPAPVRSVPPQLRCFPHRWNKLDFLPPRSTRLSPLFLSFFLPLFLSFFVPPSLSSPASDPESVLHPQHMTTGSCEIKETRGESGIMRLQSFSSLLRFVMMRSGPHCVSFILTVSCWTRSIRQTCERLCFCLCALQYGMGGSGGSKSSFTPFVDPRVYGTSPTDDDDDNISASGTFPLSLTIAATSPVVARWFLSAKDSSEYLEICKKKLKNKQKQQLNQKITLTRPTQAH